ncbi:hypothetical protein AOQ84DRAFT_387857 [Glonium stellatum]|uniref:Uncharacterized protein n=1 Tax=Glonium stellatum TaxID=574774 RepID=A0A8E2JUP8_9PEZI|nr:hypothetical protein AOQ84DRAFT_387857 [Glonium stellatum]
MVKVLENRVVDLDILPGNKGANDIAVQAKEAATEVIPSDEAQRIAANAQNCATAIGGTVGGAVKGILDTAGNTVGTLGEGLTGTVVGVGKGLGSAAQYGGNALDGAVSGAGKLLGVSKKDPGRGVTESNNDKDKADEI